MLLNLSQLVAKYNLDITGIVHVGGHFGQEWYEYSRLGITNVVFIEPCTASFAVLESRFSNIPSVKTFKCALGSLPGVTEMYVSRDNRGESNSLLKPKNHLLHYPSIKFDGTERVEVKTMDSLNLDGYIMLTMDVEGFELEVLKGGVGTLKHIDYVFTEVNRDELYKKCVQIEQLDDFLSDFDRIEPSGLSNIIGGTLFI